MYGDDKTHAKCAIADGKHGAIFSANFDAEHGIYDGTEMGMRLDGEPVLADVAHFFDHCIARAPQHLVQNPTAAQGTSLAARMLRDWPLPAWPRGAVATTRRGPALAATTGPVLFTAPAGRVAGAMTLHADGGQWTLTGPAADARWRLTMIARPATADRDRPPALLTEWLGAGRRAARNDPYGDHRRGLCSGESAARLIAAATRPAPAQRGERVHEVLVLKHGRAGRGGEPEKAPRSTGAVRRVSRAA